MKMKTTTRARKVISGGMSDAAIARRVFATPLADTHNHLFTEAQRMGEQHDFTFLFDGYAAGVLSHCGMTAEEMRRLPDKTLDPVEKWRLLAPYWPMARVTGVMRAQVCTVREIFGYDDLDEKSVGPISEQIRTTNRPGRTRAILDKAGLHHVQLNPAGVVPATIEQPGFYVYDLAATQLVSGQAIPEIEKRLGRTLLSLDDYLEGVDRCFAEFGAQANAIKFANGYFRILDFKKTDKAAAEKAFAVLNVRRTKGECMPAPETRPFEDFIYHHILDLARRYDLPIRHHVGCTAHVFHGTNEDRPHHLESIIKANPDLHFILLHAGYPYLHETLGICRSNANAYADLGWIWQIDPVASTEFVRQFVTSIGPRQLLLFGGDTGFAETSYGYSRPARAGLAQALSSLLAEGLIDARDVDTLVDRLCFENARDCFKLASKFGL